jgi:hypothetical protein
MTTPTTPAEMADEVKRLALAVRIAITRQCLSPTAANVARCDEADAALRAAIDRLAALAAIQVEPQEPNMRHPKIQALIGANARYQIEMRLAEQIVNQGAAFEAMAMDGDYWTTLHDKLVELVTPIAALKEATDALGVAPSAPGSTLQPSVSAAIPNADALAAAFAAFSNGEPTPINDAFEAWAREQWGPTASWPHNAWLGFLAGYQAADRARDRVRSTTTEGRGPQGDEPGALEGTAPRPHAQRPH